MCQTYFSVAEITTRKVQKVKCYFLLRDSSEDTIGTLQGKRFLFQHRRESCPIVGVENYEYCKTLSVLRLTSTNVPGLTYHNNTFRTSL